MASNAFVSRRRVSGQRRAERRAADLGRQRTLISPAQLARPRGRTIYWIVFAVVIALFTVAFLGPLYWMVTGGLKTTQEVVQSPPTAFPTSVHTENYSRAWTVMDLSRLLFNTLYYAFGALAFQLLFDVAAAYSLSKLRPIFGKVILGMMLATLMIPATVLVVPQYLTVLDVPIVQRNLLNSPWAIWLPSVTNAFNIFLLKRFFDSIPRELLDAAAIDGASPCAPCAPWFCRSPGRSSASSPSSRSSASGKTSSGRCSPCPTPASRPSTWASTRWQAVSRRTSSSRHSPSRPSRRCSSSCSSSATS